jgi:patatin-like phospholipase/acyl hydrolase
MQRLAPGKKPCEVFDLIGGTSTGGFVYYVDSVQTC